MKMFQALIGQERTLLIVDVTEFKTVWIVKTSVYIAKLEVGGYLPISMPPLKRLNRIMILWIEFLSQPVK